MSVHTGGTYQNEVSRTAMSPEAYVQGCTSTDCLVPPYTRCTGFQMIVCTMLKHASVCTYHEMYIHVVCTWYVQERIIINMYHDIHGTYMVCTIGAINMYVYSTDVYIHVYTFTYTFLII
jgi:hypothetical protein